MSDKPNTAFAAGKGRRFRIQPSTPDRLREGLSLLCQQFGRQVTAAELGDGLPLEAGKLPLALAPRALHRAGINARVEALPLVNIGDRLLPALLLLEDGGTLILTDWRDARARVLLPETEGGEKWLTREALESLYSGSVILAKPRYKPDQRAGDFARSAAEHWLRGPMKRFWPAYLEVGVASLVANMLAVSSSLFAMQVYDRVVPNAAFETLWVLGSGVMLAVMLEFVLRTLRAHLLDATGKRLDLLLSSRLFAQVMQIRLSAKPNSTGAFSSQVREFENVREFFTSSTAASISDLPFVVLFLTLIAYIGGPVAYVPLAIIGLMLLPSLMLQGRLARLSRANLREGAVKHGLLLESIENLETLKAVGAEGRNLLLWEQLSAQLAEDNVRMRRLSALLSYGAALLQQVCYVGVVIVGVYQINAGAMTVGALIACSILASRTVAPINQASAILVRWQHVKVALEGLDSLMASPVERPAGRQFARKPNLTGHYVLQDVVFRYHPDAPPALQIQQLQIQAGERVVLLGNNGSGKSSLLRLLAGLTDTESGQLLLDDVSLAQIDPVDRRSAIGYLPQDVALFYGSLRENLQLDGEVHSDEHLFEALDAVGLGKAVRAHALGLDMPILGSGSVSGGQRQAIGLTRLLLQDPRIVLLDEPTAAFDHDSETHVIQYLQRWLQGRTLVVSTHKRTLLALGQRGVVLRDGQVSMDGSLKDWVTANPAKSAEEGLHV